MNNYGPGTNYFAKLDENVDIAFTQSGQEAILARCSGNPNVAALHPNIYIPGCIMIRRDFNSGNNLYFNTGTLAIPIWTIVGGGGGTVPTFVFNEIPSGDIDGVNTIFNLANAPSPQTSLQLYYQGQLQIQGVDYTLSGTTITFANAPQAGLNLNAYYQY